MGGNNIRTENINSKGGLDVTKKNSDYKSDYKIDYTIFMLDDNSKIINYNPSSLPDEQPNLEWIFKAEEFEGRDIDIVIDKDLLKWWNEIGSGN
jgi:hypothetical protein